VGVLFNAYENIVNACTLYVHSTMPLYEYLQYTFACTLLTVGICSEVRRRSGCSLSEST
jgi:hypothetical protein